MLSFHRSLPGRSTAYILGLGLVTFLRNNNNNNNIMIKVLNCYAKDCEDLLNLLEGAKLTAVGKNGSYGVL